MKLGSEIGKDRKEKRSRGDLRNLLTKDGCVALEEFARVVLLKKEERGGWQTEASVVTRVEGGRRRSYGVLVV